MYEYEHSQEHQLPKLTAEKAWECPNVDCQCDMRYPDDWEEREGTLWAVTLICPNCEEESDVLMDEGEIEKFDVYLDRGRDELVRNLRNLTHSNMARGIATFVRALEDDHILPEDF